MTPRCHNRPEAAESRTRYGIHEQTGEVIAATLPRWFTDRCTLWEGDGFGPGSAQSFAQWQGYECGGCRWRVGV